MSASDTEMAGGVASPMVSFVGEVLPHWTDVNDHMNVSYFDRVFDSGESALFDAFGVEEDYTRRTGFGVFRLEKTIRYEREMRVGQRFEVRSMVAMTDNRLIHHVHELWNLSTGERSAIDDALSIHVDLGLRKSAYVGDDQVRKALAAMAAAHARLPLPPGAVARVIAGRSRA